MLDMSQRCYCALRTATACAWSPDASVRSLSGTAQLAPGDWVLMFTDGIKEARNTDGEEFGMDCLLAATNDNLARNAEEVRGQILEALKNHSRGVLQSDDVTLMVAHVSGTRAANG